MIECCSPKRMLLAILFLGILTVIVLIYESRWAFESNSGNHFGNFSGNGSALRNNTLYCRSDEDFVVLNPCHPCTDFEVTSKSNKACLPTHYKELVKCNKSGNEFYQSCDRVEWLEEKKFWQFELTTFLISLIAVPCVFLRQKTLDYRHLRNLQRRLARSV